MMDGSSLCMIARDKNGYSLSARSIYAAVGFLQFPRASTISAAFLLYGIAESITRALILANACASSPSSASAAKAVRRSEEHTSELQSLMRISYAVFCLTQKTDTLDTILVHYYAHH